MELVQTQNIMISENHYKEKQCYLAVVTISKHVPIPSLVRKQENMENS